MSKKRHPDVELIIPNKPTASITESMRTEAGLNSPEVFENFTKLKTSSSAPLPLKTTSKVEVVGKPPQVRFTNEDEVLEFDADLLQAYSRSSGTISYDSFQSPNPIAFDKSKAEAKQVKYEEPKMLVALERNLLEVSSASNEPSFQVVNDAEFHQLLHSEQCPGTFCEPAVCPSDFPSAVREQAYAKLLINELINEFLTSGREDLELTVRLTRHNKLPVINLKVEKCPASPTARSKLKTEPID